MNPADFDDDNEGLSFNELPPSMRARAVQAQAPTAPQYVQPQVQPVQAQPRPQYMPQPAPQYVPQYPPQAMPPRYALAEAPALTPTGQAGQGAIYQVATPPAASDNSSWLFLGATVLLAGVGYWAYSKMEKDKRRIRVGPARPAYEDDGDDSGADEDAGESDGPLDEYEGAGLDPKDVDPHEDGGIKMVRG